MMMRGYDRFPLSSQCETTASNQVCSHRVFRPGSFRQTFRDRSVLQWGISPDDQSLRWKQIHFGKLQIRGLMIAALLLAIFIVSGCGSAVNNFGGGPSTSEAARASSALTEPAPLSTAAEPVASSAPGNVASPSPQSAAIRATGYKVGPRDVLEISVFKVPELSSSVQVADSGTINLPLVGEVPAAGRTAQEIERDLVVKLGAKYVKSPQVTVFVKEYNSQRITVEGAVKKPGAYSIKGRTTLLQAIALANGLDANYESTVVVFRQSDGQRLAARFDIDDIKNGKAEDPIMQKGDVVVVNDSMSKKGLEYFLRLLPAVGAFVPLML
jgi:polysaccharide biosynthesis/export protein